MNKKGVMSFWGILIIVALIWFLIVQPNISKIQTGTASIFNNERITERETIYETKYVNVNTNLCNLMQPYIVVGHSDDWCIVNGGVWRCESSFVGCTNVPAPAFVDCTTPELTASTYQCQVVGGTAYCDGVNAYCTY